MKNKIGIILSVLVLCILPSMAFAATSTPGPDMSLLSDALPIIRYAINVLQLMGLGAATIVLAMYGIKWFYGGAAQKAQLKSKISTYLLAMLLLIAGPLLVKIVVEMIVIVFPG